MSEYPSDIVGAANWAVLGLGIAKDFGQERKDKLINDICYVLLSEREWRTEWRDVKFAPTDGTRILIWDELNDEASIAFYSQESDEAFTGWFHVNDWTGTAKFSWWLPLPAKPSPSKPNQIEATR